MRVRSSEARLLQLDFHRGYLLTSLNKGNGAKWANQGSQGGGGGLSSRNQAEEMVSGAEVSHSRAVNFPLMLGFWN